MEYNEEGIGTNGHTREWNEYIPIMKGLGLSLIILMFFWLLNTSSR